MPNDRTPRSLGETLEELLSFAEDPEEVAAMRPEEVSAYLKEEGIELQPHLAELNRRLMSLQGRRRLESARQERQRFQETATDPSPKNRPQSTITGDDLKAAVSRRLSQLHRQQPTQAAAYFRKLEGATDSDLRGILEDLEELERLGGTTGKETPGGKGGA